MFCASAAAFSPGRFRCCRRHCSPKRTSAAPKAAHNRFPTKALSSPSSWLPVCRGKAAAVGNRIHGGAAAAGLSSSRLIRRRRQRCCCCYRRSCKVPNRALCSPWREKARRAYKGGQKPISRCTCVQYCYFGSWSPLSRQQCCNARHATAASLSHLAYAKAKARWKPHSSGPNDYGPRSPSCRVLIQLAAPIASSLRLEGNCFAGTIEAC